MKKKIFLSLIAFIAIATLSFVNNSNAKVEYINSCCCAQCVCTDCGNCCSQGNCENCADCSSCCTSSNCSMPHNSDGTSQGIETMSPDSAICMVSGEPLESGKGVGFTYLGKEYKFCCAGCIEEFKAEPMNYLKDEIQCPVMEGAAKKDVSTVVDGVKYYFCCAGCDDKFKANPEKYMNGSVEKESKHEGHH
ncbi:MAG TPA: YHS domain-containing protein [Ignavibacteria bacterium]|nr:YHS domain-containing protein [Ignavibacteria bacterium]